MSAELLERTGKALDPSQFSLAVTTDGDVYYAETDLLRMGLDDLLVHQVVERGLLALGAVAQSLEKMKAYSSLCGFRPNELPVIEDQLGFLWRDMSPTEQERRFMRVMELADFPAFTDPAVLEKVNIATLLKVRSSGECVEFRQWLRSVDEVDDAELKDRIGSLRSKLGVAVNGVGGKLVRLATTTALGFVPGAGIALGPAASALDAFVVDKLFPRSGPLAFLEELLPSIFR